MSKFNIDTAFLPDEEADRLYKRYPNLGKSSEDYCPTCHKKGSYRWRGQEWKCDCHHQLQLYKHYLAAGIGVTYQRLEWIDVQGRDDIVGPLAKYLTNHVDYVGRGVGLFFTGTVGTGKTLLTTLCLKTLVKFGYSCFATTFAQTIDMLTAGWHSPEEKLYFRKKFVDSQVLLLDDVGREMRTKLSESTFDSILRTRVQEGRPTFVTTNMTSSEIESGYGSGVLSLLMESSISWEFSGDDFRPQAQMRTLEEIRKGETRPIA